MIYLSSNEAAKADVLFENGATLLTMNQMLWAMKELGERILN